MVRPPQGTHNQALVDALQACAASLQLKCTLRVIGDEEYDAWVNRQGKSRFILTLLARSITAVQFQAVSQMLADQGLNIDVITRLSGRPSRVVTNPLTRACVEFSLRGEPRDSVQLKASLLELSSQLSLDLAWQRDDAYRRNRRVVALDMDSTLLQAEVIDELAKEAGAGEKVSAITEAAMRGEIDFDESLRQRVGSLAGMPESVLPVVAARLQLTEGAELLLTTLRRFGYRTAIISGASPTSVTISSNAWPSIASMPTNLKSSMAFDWSSGRANRQCSAKSQPAGTTRQRRGCGSQTNNRDW